MKTIDEQPYRCRLCNHTFFPNEDVIKHLLKYHKDRLLHVWFSLAIANDTRLNTHIKKLFFDMIKPYEEDLDLK